MEKLQVKASQKAKEERRQDPASTVVVHISREIARIRMRKATKVRAKEKEKEQGRARPTGAIHFQGQIGEDGTLAQLQVLGTLGTPVRRAKALRKEVEVKAAGQA